MKYYSANIAVAAVATLIIVMLAGCNVRTGDKSPVTYDPVVFTDRGTGCQYLAPGMDSRSSLTRRTAADGVTHKGCGEVAK